MLSSEKESVAVHLRGEVPLVFLPAGVEEGVLPSFKNWVSKGAEAPCQWRLGTVAVAVFLLNLIIAVNKQKRGNGKCMNWKENWLGIGS